MKLYIAILFVLFTYLAQASNVCFQTPVTCNDVYNCNLNCQATLATILNNVPTMESVWQWTIHDFGGSWTVVQTENANWYSRALFHISFFA